MVCPLRCRTLIFDGEWKFRILPCNRHGWSWLSRIRHTKLLWDQCRQVSKPAASDSCWSRQHPSRLMQYPRTKLGCHRIYRNRNFGCLSDGKSLLIYWYGQPIRKYRQSLRPGVNRNFQLAKVSATELRWISHIEQWACVKALGVVKQSESFWHSRSARDVS